MHSKLTYTYPEEKKMIVKHWYYIIGWELADYVIYYYDNSHLITSLEKYDSDDNLTARAVFINTTGEAYNLITATWFDQNDTEIYNYKIEYLDENGSSITKYYSDDGILYKTGNWTRDNKKGAYFTTDPFPYQHVNNVISREVKYTNGTIADYSFTTVIEYDLDNYPTKKIKSYHDGKVEVISYKYVEN